MKEFRIGNTGDELRIVGDVPAGLVDYDNYRIEVGLHLGSLEAVTSVYDIQPQRWIDFFDDIATHWRGWEGCKQYESLEHDFRLEATSDRTGHIRFRVTLRDPHSDCWRAEGSIVMEAGQLDDIARDARDFWGG